MKKLIYLILLMSSLDGSAQNYQCLQAGVKHYFINGNGYLRGIRVDSVVTSGGTTIYYPYRTPRGYYYPTGVTGSTSLDSSGGSWLGSKVVAQADGTFLFDNLWHDTVVIKTLANPGDSWVFYRDTTSLYYQANLLSADTMTILGITDSIKRILITARNSLGYVASDPVDSFQIIFSKNNGFAQVFDLFTFPYHAPGAPHAQGLDYFLDKTIEPMYSPDATNAVFRLANFTSPSSDQLYQWNTGDVYEYSICRLAGETYCLCDPAYEYDMDTVASVSILPAGVQYPFYGSVASIVANLGEYSSYTTTPNTGVLTCDTSRLVTTSLMPEEFNQPYLYYYWPNDASYGIENPLYETIVSDIMGSLYQEPFEWSDATTLYKSPFGLLHSHFCATGSGTSGFMFDVDDVKLIYYNRAGSTYGSTNSIAAVTASMHDMNIYPNPSSKEITIISDYMITSIAIVNVFGQTLFSSQFSANKVLIDVAWFPTGIYFVKINGSEVRKFLKE